MCAETRSIEDFDAELFSAIADEARRREEYCGRILHSLGQQLSLISLILDRRRQAVQIALATGRRP